MNFGTFIGPATLVYLVGATFAAIWWAAGINSDVHLLRMSQVTDGRISRLEQRVDTLNDNTKELKSAITDLVRELRRNP